MVLILVSANSKGPPTIARKVAKTKTNVNRKRNKRIWGATCEKTDLAEIWAQGLDALVKDFIVNSIKALAGLRPARISDSLVKDFIVSSIKALAGLRPARISDSLVKDFIVNSMAFGRPEFQIL